MSSADKTPILVIDDEPPIRRLLRTSLTANGFEIFEAANGLDGLAAILAHRPELVVLDLESRSEVRLNQGARSVDDQVEWLDDSHVVYHDVTEDGTGIWTLPTDGTTGPSLLLADAFSPAVQR